MKLTGVILTRNEEDKIPRLIKELKFCDEVLIIDDNSTDETIQKAKVKRQKYKSKVKIFRRSLNNNYAAQRNFAIRKAQGKWVLFIDADEKVTAKLKKEILQAVKSKNIKGFKVKRTDIRWGRKMKYGETANTYLLRLARKSGKWRRKVHEVWDIKGNIAALKNEILHYPEENLIALVKKTTQYGLLHGEELVREKKDPKFAKIFIYPAGKFRDNLIIKKAYKDGWQGILLALIMSYHSFLGWSKAWWISKKFN